uniref:Uncharacterized protein n=1 Tax=Steinernema glaseri TaxID=37863 RepID=A0A1I7ZNJ7_9BILA
MGLLCAPVERLCAVNAKGKPTPRWTASRWSSTKQCCLQKATPSTRLRLRTATSVKSKPWSAPLVAILWKEVSAATT